jgi:hypothetical protein
MFLKDVCRILEQEKVEYAVVGGCAVALHGVVRGTVDVDIAIKWSLENLKKMEKALKKIGLVSTLPINAENLFHYRDEYVKNRNLIAWNFYNPRNPLHQLDVVVTFNLHANEIETLKTSFGKVKVLKVKDLIKMKKKAGRPQDLVDVEALERL